MFPVSRIELPAANHSNHYTPRMGALHRLGQDCYYLAPPLQHGNAYGGLSESAVSVGVVDTEQWLLGDHEINMMDSIVHL